MNVEDPLGAALQLFIDVAYEMRRNPGASNASPGVTATRASSSSACASRADVRMPSGDRNSETSGNR